MEFDLSKGMDVFEEGVKNIATEAHQMTKSFHENYVSKVTPDFGKYGDCATFVAEMVPGVSEYNSIREGDWTGFAIAAGIDIAAVAVGAFSAGAGYAAVKGGGIAAKNSVRVAAKEVAEISTKKVMKEVAETTAKDIAKETAGKVTKKIALDSIKQTASEVAESGAKKIVKETTSEVVEKIAKTNASRATGELAEQSAKNIIKETTEELVEKKALESAEKIAGEVVESSTEKVIKDIEKEEMKKVTLEIGESIDKTKIPNYIKEIETITSRELNGNQKELLEKALKETDFVKLSAEKNLESGNIFRMRRPDLLREWEINTQQRWPTYTDDILNEAGNVIRKAGAPYDAHHIIEKSVGGPHEWWNLHPAAFPNEHQMGIHGAMSYANQIFG